MTKLWPRHVGNMTDEQESSFRRVLGRYQYTQVQSAMRGAKDHGVKYPEARDIAKELQTDEAETGGAKQNGGGATFHDQVRRRWAKESPTEAYRIYAMTDHDVDVAFAHGEWEGCEAVYGAGLSSFAAWRKWQRLLGNEATTDELRAEYDRVTDVMDYDRLREARDMKAGVMQ